TGGSWIASPRTSWHLKGIASRCGARGTIRCMRHRGSSDWAWRRISRTESSTRNYISNRQSGVTMDIEWPPFPPDGVLERPATEEDIAAGRAAFVLRDPSRRLVGSRVALGLPRLGYYSDSGERWLGVVIQTETPDGQQIIVGVRHTDGSFSVCTPE